MRSAGSSELFEVSGVETGAAVVSLGELSNSLSAAVRPAVSSELFEVSGVETGAAVDVMVSELD